jgi:putative endonuclease
MKKLKNNDWFLYIVRCSDGTLYTGVTIDVQRRLKEHNYSSRGAKYTRSRRPVDVVHWKLFKDRSSAQKAEYKFKQLTKEQKEKAVGPGVCVPGSLPRS